MKVLNVLQTQIFLKQSHYFASSTSLFSHIHYFDGWNACFYSQKWSLVSTLLPYPSCSHQPLNRAISPGYLSPSSNMPTLLHVQGHCHGSLFDHASLEPQKQSSNFTPFLKSNILHHFSPPQPGQCFRYANCYSAWNFFQFFPDAYRFSRNKRLFLT